MILWEWKTGEMLQKYNGFNPITSLAAAEAKFIAVSAHQDNRLMLWDLYKDYRLYYPTGINDIDAVAISPDGTWVLITTHGPAEFRLYKLDSENGVVKEQLDLPCESTHRLALSSDGSFVLVSCQSAIYKVDVQPLRVEHIFLNSTDSINDIAVSKDGLLSLVSYADGSLRIVSLGSELEYEISDTQLADIVAAEVSSDELFWLVNDVSGMPGDQPGLWDMQRGEIMHIFSGFDGESLPGGNAISPDTQSIAIAGWKRDSTDYARISPTVMVWDRSSQEVLCKIDEKSGTYNALEFSPDSTLLAVAWQDQKIQSGRLSLWEVQSCQQLKQFSAPAAVTNLDFSSDGTRLAAGISNDEKTILWDAGSGEEIKHFTSLDGSSIHDVVFGPDDLVLLGTGTGELYLWDVNSTQVIRTYSAQKATARSAIISPRGRYVLAGTLNGDLILWDFNTGEELRRLSTQLDLVYIGFSLDETKVIGVARNGESITWHIAEKSLSELVEWVKTNRYQSVLSCDERELYHVEPLCAP
jgi:WD40 repeat protein